MSEWHMEGRNLPSDRASEPTPQNEVASDQNGTGPGKNGQPIPENLATGTMAQSNGSMADSSQQLTIQQLIRDHHEPIFRYAFRLTGNRDDAEDLTQQAFLVAHQKLHQIREPAKARSWLYAVLRSCFLKSQRKPRPTPITGVEMDVNDIPQNPANEDNIDRERLQLVLDELPADFKVVLLMFYFEGCSYKEIADQLELPVGTVMSRLSRAKSRLRGRLIGTNLNV